MELELRRHQNIDVTYMDHQLTDLFVFGSTVGEYIYAKTAKLNSSSLSES